MRPRRAFTLVELLVVIAIISVLAAILFPVFAKAKTVAKTTVAVSNQKQIGLAILMYAADHDDAYPRDDGCVAGSSMNPQLNDGQLRCGGRLGFGHRVNHFSWQKWPMPYVRNVDLFEHPLRQRNPRTWQENGELTYGFVVNLAITGALDVYGREPDFPRQYRDSFLGGTTSRVPHPSSTAVLMELPWVNVAMLPGGTVDDQGVGPRMMLYPVAIREFWRWKLMDGGQADCVARRRGTMPDEAKIAGGGITLGMADGSAKFMTAGQFLAATPSKAQYLGVDPGSSTAGWTYPTGGAECNSSTVGNYGFTTTPDVHINYPLWGLGE